MLNGVFAKKVGLCGRKELKPAQYFLFSSALQAKDLPGTLPGGLNNCAEDGLSEFASGKQVDTVSCNLCRFERNFGFASRVKLQTDGPFVEPAP